MIEPNEIFEQIKQDSQTSRQVITETNYIIGELTDYKKQYALSIDKCPHCSADIQVVDDRENNKYYLWCEECKSVIKIK